LDYIAEFSLHKFLSIHTIPNNNFLTLVENLALSSVSWELKL